MKPMNWIDIPFFSKKRTVLTQNELMIPGLRTLGQHNISTAISPLPPHIHKNCFEITYIANGTISFFINEAEYKISGGDVFISYPDEVHSTNHLPLSVGSVYWFQLDISDPAGFLYLQPEWAQALIDGLKNIKAHVVKTNKKQMEQLTQQIFHLSRYTDRKFELCSYLVCFLHKLVEFSGETQFQLTPDIGKAVDYILDHLTESISLEFIASLCLLSTSQFKQKFKNQIGVSPREFINFRKIELAKSYLESGKSVTDTAMELSFNSSSYFCCVFKRYTSYTPKEYLKSVSKSDH